MDRGDGDGSRLNEGAYFQKVQKVEFRGEAETLGIKCGWVRESDDDHAGRTRWTI